MPTIQKTLRILEFIRSYQQSNDEAPTIREIGEEFDMSSSASVHYHLAEMQRRGWIKRSREWRSIQVTKPAQERKNAA